MHGRDSAQDVIPDDWEPGQEARVLPFRRRAPQAAPSRDWEGLANSLGDIEQYDPLKHRDPAELYNHKDLDHLYSRGFYPVDAHTWQRPVTTDRGESLGVKHTIFYQPGHRNEDGRLMPWHLMTDPEQVGTVHPTLHGPEGVFAAARAETLKLRNSPKFARLELLAVQKTPAQIAAEKWLEENSDEFEHWEPNPGDYTYRDYGDAAGQSFHGDEAQSHVLPGSAYDPEPQGMSDSDWERFHSEREQRAPTNRFQEYEDEDYEVPQHEQDLADLGFNWQNRGDPNTTPVGEYQEGEYVRHQHDPEGRHIATHTIRRVPYTNTWHVESTDPSDSNFAYESSEHHFPGDAISRYHDNAERALLPTRGYEPHRGRSGAVTHWTRTDTDPHSGRTYEHEISNQPNEGEHTSTGWLGHTVSEGMIAPSHGTGPLREQDLADVVREHDRTGRGLHPGGSQDNRMTRDELLSDPSVARLGTPHHISDRFYRGDNKVGSARWSMPHPTDTERPINAEATYNWDKGGYDFKYTHDGQRLFPNHEHFPAGAPVHVPGRQTHLF